MTEPLVHFVFLGALLFLAHRLAVGDPRIIVVSPGVRADLERRFRDHNGRPPSTSELESDLRGWKRDEALYREALRDQLDRNDATIRTVLADRERARAALGTRKREPSTAELDHWLATHRTLYETPARYDYQSVVFPKTPPSSRPGSRDSAQALPAATPLVRATSVDAASGPIETYEQALKDGASAEALGRPVVGGNLTAEDLQERFGAALAARIQRLPIGQWQRLEDEEHLLLVRVNAVEGGLPDAEELHARLVADWSFAEEQQAVEAAVQAIVNKYRVEERP